MTAFSVIPPAGPRAPFLDLARQCESIRDELDRAIRRVVDRGWFVLGPEVEAFERSFADYCGVRHAVGVNSGTDAIQLALRAVGVKPGDGVITVPNVSAPTACAIAAAGARPVFADIDPVTYNLSPESLREALRSPPVGLRISAVVPVHLYGHPAEMGEIVEVARSHGAEVVEDAAQAHGARYHGKHVGGLCAAGCFSFYPTKNLGALGDAGAVVTHDDAIAGRLRMLRNYGEVAKYRNQSLGVNTRLDEIQAAVLSVKLGHLEGWVDARRRMARGYGEALAGTGLATPVERRGCRHAYHLYVVRVSRRDEFRAWLDARGVDTAVHYPTPLHLQESLQDLGHRAGDFPEAERACREVVSLPLYPEMTESEFDRVVRAATEFASEERGRALGNR